MSTPAGNPKGSKGLSPKAEYLIERHGSVLLVWLLLLFMSWTRNGAKLLRGELASNDDYMRMVEVRDWLGGQNWFDMHQYRLNPVDPLYSHWSRISDVLIGGPIKLLTPIIGQANAEITMVIVYPAALLLIFLYLVIALSRTISKAASMPLAAAFMTALSFATLAQFHLGRIDHHGLQIVMALACCWCLIKSAHGRRYAVFAGILCGLGLYVGIESAPYVAAACVSVVLVWVMGEANATQRLRFFGLAMAATTLLSLLISAPPSRWMLPTCDALSVVYTQLTLAVALALWALSRIGHKVTAPWPRFFIAGALGGIALIMTGILYPECLRGPYAEIDPRLAEVWLANVSEAGKYHDFLKGDIVGGLAVIMLPIFTLIGYWLYARTEKVKAFAAAPRTILIFMLLTFAAGLVQFRLMSFASSLAIPFAAFLLSYAFEWAGKFKQDGLRILVRLGFIVLLAPLTLPLVASLFVPGNDVKISNDLESKADGRQNSSKKLSCTSQPILDRLNQLPGGTALTQIDLGAPILKFTNLSVTSAPYHRNTMGNLAALDMFIEDEAAARAAIARTGADYVIACHDMGETNLLIQHAPGGMLARLKDGYVPDWLETLDVGSDKLMVYKVK